jgi:hypothetical protein
VYDHSGAGHVDGRRRIKLVLGGHPVKPDRCATNMDFAMHSLAGGVPFNAPAVNGRLVRVESDRCEEAPELDEQQADDDPSDECCRTE